MERLRIKGRIWKEGKFWAVECPTLHAHTQGTSREDGLAMMKDWLLTMLDAVKGLKVDVELVNKKQDDGSYVFDIVVQSHVNAVVALVILRNRQFSGITMEKMAKNMGKASKSSVKNLESPEADHGIGKVSMAAGALGYDVVFGLEKRRA